MTATTIDNTRFANAIKSIQQINRYEGPQWFVSPQGEWEDMLDLGDDSIVEVLDTNVIGWGPANAIVRITSEGVEYDFLAEVGPEATVGMPHDSTFVTHMEYGNTWPLLDTETITIIGITDADDPQPFVTGNVRNGTFVEDENDNLFAVRA